jgi:hypothetical protein
MESFAQKLVTKLTLLNQLGNCVRSTLDRLGVVVRAPGYRSSCLSVKLVPTFADGGCSVVSATDPHARILGFLDRCRYYFFQAAPQLYSRCWVNPVADPLLLRNSGRAGNRGWDLWICSQELWPLDHGGGFIQVQIQHGNHTGLFSLFF